MKKVLLSLLLVSSIGLQAADGGSEKGFLSRVVDSVEDIARKAIDSVGALVSEEETSGVDWRKRPKEVQEYVDYIFSELSSKKFPWGINDAHFEEILLTDQRAFFKSIILDGYKEGRREFYALDLGDSNGFAWVNGMAEYINDDVDIPDDVKIHIIGVLGGQTDYAGIEQKGKCKLYKHGQFKIENLEEMKDKLSGFEDDKMDLIVANYLFLHLVDPIGTWQQAFNLLRPESGVFVFDGFTIFCEQSREFSRLMPIFLKDLNVPFVMEFNGSTEVRGEFYARKPREFTWSSSFDYEGLKSLPVRRTVLGDRSKNLHLFYTFNDPDRLNDLLKSIKNDHASLPNSEIRTDDQEFYEWLVKKGFFVRRRVSPVFE